jgi:hypothetical protein
MLLLILLFLLKLEYNLKIPLKIIFVMLNLIIFFNLIMNKLNLKFIEYLYLKDFFKEFNANF